MKPTPMFHLQLNFLQWGLGCVTDIDQGVSAMVIGPLVMATTLGFQWKLKEGQELFKYDWYR